MRRIVAVLVMVAALGLVATCGCDEPQTPRAVVIGDYDSELRKGEHVDSELMARRLIDLGANTYMWLIWHNANDWEDLREFLPLARDANIRVWVYLVPHSETALTNPKWPYSEPFKLDYVRWAEEIARLSLQHESVVGYVIDDFWGNVTPDRFSAEYTEKMVLAGKAINPALKFYPLMYYRQIGIRFMKELAPLVDGVVAAYPRSADEIEKALTYLNDEYAIPSSVSINYPWGRPSKPGECGFVSQRCEVTDADAAEVSFRYQDDFDGPTEGYHIFQLRVDDTVVWEEDAAGHDDRTVTVDLSEAVAGKQECKVSLGVFDKKGVSHFGLETSFGELKTEGLKLADADLASDQAWQPELRGGFTVQRLSAESGERQRRLPLIVMTAGSRSEYEHRHGVKATPELLASQVSMALEFAREDRIEGVVTYCLNKTEGSEDFEAVRKAFADFGASQEQP